MSNPKPEKQVTVKTKNTARRSPGPRATTAKPKGKRKKKGKKDAVTSLRKNVLLLAIEVVGMTITGVAAIIVLLGYTANRLSGTSFFTSLLPFASGILCFIVLTAILLSGWQRIRRWLQTQALFLPSAIALCLAMATGYLAMQDRFSQVFGYYRTLVGGKEEAGRVTLAHQVYAAYRRLEATQLAKMIERAERYQPALAEAAATFDLDLDILQGLAAAESSFLPRESSDGGQGLLQITQIPTAVAAAVDKLFPPEKRTPADPRYNTFLGAATLRHYLTEMHDDLYLGLLAYNIGPKNGGLRFIMQQYGATDFVTIQPYLQQLPRDYPIRVLAFSLAFRIQKKEGRLLAYEEGTNALRIQGLGIPGLTEERGK